MKNLLKYTVTIIFLTLLISCEKEENSHSSFELESLFDSIRSCPGGGGLFILRLNNPDNQKENIHLSLTCNEKLNAVLTITDISADQPVTEVLIKPGTDIPVSSFKIVVTGEQNNFTDSVELKVKIVEWTSSTELSDLVSARKEEFIDWLTANYSEININNQTTWDFYLTYPQIIIVEHITLLNDTYELRICNHAMIPPNDWTMIRLRKRNTYEPFLAAKKDSTGGIIYETPVSEYPLLLGY